MRGPVRRICGQRFYVERLAEMNSGRVLAYGLLGMPLAFAALPIYVHVPRFYAQTAGLELALIGFTLLAMRLLDAGIDPWLGWLADRLPRPRLLLAALLPLTLGFLALFNPPDGGATLWLVGSLALTYLGFSSATIALQAWGADLGSDSTERTRLTAAREGFALLGVVLAAALPTWLATDLNEGVQRLSWLLPPLLVFAAWISLRYSGPSSPQFAPPVSLLISLREVFSDRAFRRLLIVFMANGIAAALPATLFLFFVADVLQNAAASGPLLALYFIAGAASLPLWVRLAVHQGRVRAWLLAMGGALLAFAGAGLLVAGDVIPFAVICVASGMALGADLALPAAIAADIGERRGQAGTCFGAWNFVAKHNLALAAGLALPLLGFLGYVPGTGEGLSALSFAYAFLPLAFKLLAAILLWRWRDSLEI